MKLVVQTHGTNLSLQNGMVIIEADDQKREIALLHITSIHILENARISSALISACAQNQIPILIENDINIEAMIWSPHYGSIARIRQKQALFSISKLKFKLIKKILTNKNTQRYEWIHQTTSRNETLETIEQILAINNQILQAPDDPDKLRSLEAHASKIYFQALKQLVPEKFKFEKRTHKNSTDAFNSILNYAYGMLYKYMYKTLIVAGLDPHLGFFHAIRHNQPTLTYDLIENYRPWIEKWIVNLLKNPQFQKLKKHMENNKIHPDARKMIIEHITQKLHHQKIKHKNMIRTPATHIQIDMHNFAQYLLQLSREDLIRNIK